MITRKIVNFGKARMAVITKDGKTATMILRGTKDPSVSDWKHLQKRLNWKMSEAQ